MKFELSNSRILFVAYFNQDWDLDYDDYSSVVNDFLRSEPPDLVKSTKEEIKNFLNSEFINESVIEDTLREIGCYFFPYEYNTNYTDWLKSLLKYIDASIQ